MNSVGLRSRDELILKLRTHFEINIVALISMNSVCEVHTEFVAARGAIEF